MTFRRIWNGSFMLAFASMAAILWQDFSTPFVGYGAGVGTSCAVWAFCNLVKEWDA